MLESENGLPAEAGGRLAFPFGMKQLKCSFKGRVWHAEEDAHFGALCLSSQRCLWCTVAALLQVSAHF